MSSNLRPLAKVAPKEDSVRESSHWFRRARNSLGLTAARIAAAIGVTERTYWNWENRYAAAPHWAYLRVRALLNEQNRDSSGRLKVTA